MNGWREKQAQWLRGWRERWLPREQGSVWLVIIPVFLLGQLGLAWYWSQEPEPFPVTAEGKPVAGQLLTKTLRLVAKTLTEKPGGYLYNDKLPPGLLLDNMPAWELGVLQQVRDLTQALRRDMAISPAHFQDDRDLAEAEQAFSIAANAWLFSSAEQSFQQGNRALGRYEDRLVQGQSAAFRAQQAQLLLWLTTVDKRLAQQIAQLNSALPDPPLVVTVAGEMQAAAKQPWWRVDDVFYEARGSAWALMHLLSAAELEFAPVLAPRGAQLSLRAAIHELEATQQPLWSPIILNGSGFGVFASHPLVMANYLRRARADLSDVRALLQVAPSSVSTN